MCKDARSVKSLVLLCICICIRLGGTGTLKEEEPHILYDGCPSSFQTHEDEVWHCV